MATSKLQRECKRLLRYHFGKYVIVENLRPDWLINDETGKPLELDFYIEELNLAVEVQGQQHVQFTPHFHETLADFEYRRRLDNLKRSICGTRNVVLFELFKENQLDDLMTAIRNHEAQHYQQRLPPNVEGVISSLAAQLRNLEGYLKQRRGLGESAYHMRVHNARHKLLKMATRYELGGGEPLPEDLVTLVIRMLELMDKDRDLTQSAIENMLRDLRVWRLGTDDDEDELIRLRKMVKHEMQHLAYLMCLGFPIRTRLALIDIGQQWHNLGGNRLKHMNAEQMRIKIAWLKRKQRAFKNPRQPRILDGKVID